MIVLVCGGRHYDDWQRVFRVLDIVVLEHGEDVRIVTGGARGADFLAELWAKEHGYACHVERADWKAHGRAAGPIRNQKMLDDHAVDLVVAFPGGRGTADMVQRAKNQAIKVQFG